MAYEYEGKSNISFSIGNKLHFWNVTDDNLREELEEVYAKAKAFDKIKKLRNNHYIYSKTNNGTPITVLDAKTFGREASHLINKNGYTEDK